MRLHGPHHHGCPPAPPALGERLGGLDVVAIRMAKEVLRTQRRGTSPAPARHETNGERLLWGTGLVILVAFAARAFTGWYEGEDVLAALSPARSTASWALSGSV